MKMTKRILATATAALTVTAALAGCTGGTSSTTSTAAPSQADANKVYNIGNNSPENLLDFVIVLQDELIRAGVLPNDYDFESYKELIPMQPEDVPVTYADTTPLEQDFGFKPSTSLREGLRKFAGWYAKYYGTFKYHP